MGLSAALDVPGIDLALQIQSSFQQPAVDRGEVPDDFREGRPEGIDFYPGTRDVLVIDCFVE